MVREVEVDLPSVAGMESGTVKAIAFQDLPGRAVGTFHAVDPSLKGTVGLGLLALACGRTVDLDIYGYGELLQMFERWQDASLDLETLGEESDTGVDWDELI